MTFDKEAIRRMRQDEKEKPQKQKVDRVRFTFKGGKACTLKIDDFTSGAAMVEAAEAWAAKQ